MPSVWRLRKMIKYLFFLKRILKKNAACTSLGTSVARGSSRDCPLCCGARLGIMANDRLPQSLPWIQALLKLASRMTVTPDNASAVLFTRHFVCIVYFNPHNLYTKEGGFYSPYIPSEGVTHPVSLIRFPRCPGFKERKRVMWTQYCLSLQAVVLATSCTLLWLKRNFYTWYCSHYSGQKAESRWRYAGLWKKPMHVPRVYMSKKFSILNIFRISHLKYEFWEENFC